MTDNASGAIRRGAQPRLKYKSLQPQYRLYVTAAVMVAVILTSKPMVHVVAWCGQVAGMDPHSAIPIRDQDTSRVFLAMMLATVVFWTGLVGIVSRTLMSMVLLLKGDTYIEDAVQLMRFRYPARWEAPPSDHPPDSN